MQRVRVSSHQSPVHKLGASQMTLSPKFKLNAFSPSPSSSLSESEGGGEFLPLIPGLPDDIALNCLLRIPVHAHPLCRPVCKRWRSLLLNKETFFTLRRQLGLVEPWLFVFSFHRCTGKIQWQVLDLVRLCWHTLPSMPCKDRVCPPGFGCIAMSEQGALYVCGGMLSDIDCPMDRVLKYEVHRNRWTVMNHMLTPRSFFASGMINGRIYAAGGNSTDLFELNSAEVFDPMKGYWRSIAKMGANMASYDAAVLDAKLYVTEGWLWPFSFSPRGQVYDPETDKWETMAAGMTEGWTGASLVLHGHLFVVSEHERMRLKVYDVESDSWDAVDGPPVPKQVCKPFSANATNGRIYVVGRNLHVAVGYIRMRPTTMATTTAEVEKKNGKKEKVCFSVYWKAIDAPRALCDLTPSSSQVLYA
ncbi:F-box/kelch-repeat protein At1g30090 [Amborella trichopoda]|uniref:F-box domain-containing protein n=1 Tax=Amborella trichopoda TaxID=13333 RepID=W1NUM4_AMBTC|nr:F-box/kelch-repeat protein At1g30090 [Amborella trichopoda]ERM99292.1 hypothetical protein AMTR_s00092p00167170 [Amborella trichopoda]|eukprot:XP_006836439.1 F-box/kelch-repeat protein At1g30090 [Amborella trichopoda]